MTPAVVIVAFLLAVIFVTGFLALIFHRLAGPKGPTGPPPPYHPMCRCHYVAVEDDRTKEIE